MGFENVLLVRLTLSCHGIDIWQLLSRFEVQVHVSVPEPIHSDRLVHRAVPIDIRYESWPAIRMPTFCPFPFERCQSNLHRATRPAMLATELVTASQSLAFGSRLWRIWFIGFDKFYANNEQLIGIVLTQHVRPFGETMFKRFHWIRDRHAFFCFISNQSIDCGAVVLLTNHFDFLLRHVRDLRILFVEIFLQRRTFCPFSFVLLFLFAERGIMKNSLMKFNDCLLTLSRAAACQSMTVKSTGVVSIGFGGSTPGADRPKSLDPPRGDSATCADRPEPFDPFRPLVNSSISEQVKSMSRASPRMLSVFEYLSAKKFFEISKFVEINCQHQSTDQFSD